MCKNSEAKPCFGPCVPRGRTFWVRFSKLGSLVFFAQFCALARKITACPHFRGVSRGELWPELQWSQVKHRDIGAVLLHSRIQRYHTRQVLVPVHYLEGESYTVWGVRLWKRFCKMFSESYPCLFGQQGSCSTAQRPVELSETFYKTFFTTCSLWGIDVARK